MKNKRRKSAALLVSLAMLASMGACGKKPESQMTDSGGQSGQESQAVQSGSQSAGSEFVIKKTKR